MVSQIFVHGDSLQSYLVAICTLKKDIVRDWAFKLNIELEEAYDS